MLLPAPFRPWLAAVLLAAPLAALAQAGGVRIGTAGVPDASAVLDLRPDAAAAPKGFLPPRLSPAQRDAIGSPAPGLTIYNTGTNQLNVWNGTAWVAYLADTSGQGPMAFAYTGAPQTYTVPAGVRSLTVDMAGAAGGRDLYGNPGGLGGRVQATLAVTPGEVLTLYVAGAGDVAVAGFNGGGGSTRSGGGGGGASDLRQGGTALTSRVVVAGGGGGAGNNSGGACGGGLTACTAVDDPYGSTGGQGGSPASAGAGGTGTPPGTPGTASVGGDGNDYSGGGGGGYFGGGSGGGGTGGGGGSSFAGPGTSGVVHTQGAQAGNGYVLLGPAMTSLPAPFLDGSHFVNVPGDNLGNHLATKNLDLGTNQLVGNGGSAGLRISSAGRVGIGTTAPNSGLQVANSLSLAVREVPQAAGAYQDVTLTDTDHTVRSGTPAGVSGGAVFSFFLPDPTQLRGRVYVLLNPGATPANLYAGNSSSQTLVLDDATGATVPQVLAHTQLTLQSTGSQWVVLARAGDNLGNHTATQSLNLAGNALIGTGSDLGTTVGLGVRADGGLNLGQSAAGNNVLVGYQAGQATTSSFNTFVGYQSGLSNTSGAYNLFVGFRSGSGNTTGGNNQFVGYGSGNFNTTGSNNLFSGYASGYNNSTGSNNTAVGAGSGPTTGALTNAAAFGANAQVSQSNSLVLGGTGANAVRVGIGTTAPRGQLDVAGGDTYLVADPNNGSGQTAYLPGHLFLAPYSGTSGTAYVQARVPNPSSSSSLGLTLRTTNGTTLVDALTLSANGDAALARNVAVAGTLGVAGNTTVAGTLGVTGNTTLTGTLGVIGNTTVAGTLGVTGNAAMSGSLDVAGSVGIGLVSTFYDFNLSGNNYGQRAISCPAGTYLLTGGGGHRDFNSAQQDIVINYSGPDPNNLTSGWLLRLTNNSSSDRAIRIYCNCARIR